MSDSQIVEVFAAVLAAIGGIGALLFGWGASTSNQQDLNIGAPMFVVGLACASVVWHFFGREG
jgi:fatty acid desaturase